MAKKGVKLTEEHKRKIGLANSIVLTGRKLTASHKKNISLSNEKKSYDWLKGKKQSIETRMKRSKSLKKAYREGRRNNYKGGITSVNNLIRKSVEYKLWREAVYKRDNYICVWCGQKGGELNADHIKPFSLFKELRFDINNGRTLCKKCHKKTDTFGELAKRYKEE